MLDFAGRKTDKDLPARHEPLSQIHSVCVLEIGRMLKVIAWIYLQDIADHVCKSVGLVKVIKETGAERIKPMIH
jgi:hypothetical protein